MDSIIQGDQSFNHVLFVYATETGNAEEIAYSLCETCRLKHSVSAAVLDVSLLNLQRLQQHEDSIVVFIVSTTGDGDVPRSMKSFWNSLLRKGLVSSTFRCNYAVFGLGDSSYEKFNVVGRKLFVRLQQLGAKPLLPLGLGDDQAGFGYLTAFNTWESRFFETISSMRMRLPLASNVNDTVVKITIASDEEKQRFHPQFRVVENKRLTDSSWFQDIRLISLESQEGVTLSYELGDSIAIYYRNDPTLVNRAITLFDGEGLRADTSINVSCDPSLSRKSRVQEFTGTMSLLFSTILDLGGIPKRSYFSHLATFATNEEEQLKLIEISSPAGTDLFFDYCLREKRNYIDVLEEFRSVKIPLHKFLPLIPCIAPRLYSIASSVIVNPSKIDICVAIAEVKTPLGRNRVGLCSGYLRSLRPGDNVRAVIEKGPVSQCVMRDHLIGRKPLICVGPGTGIAPIRAITQSYLHHQLPNSNNLLTLVVFNGCRRRNKDTLFAEEWKQDGILVESDGKITNHAQVFMAFSQEGLIKEYVTHKIKQQGEIVWKLLSEGASVFISGSAKRMPQDVKKSFISVCCSHGNMTEAAAEEFIQNKMRKKEYLVEAWS